MISFDTTSLVKTIIAVLLALAVLLVVYNRQRITVRLERAETFVTYLTFVLLRLVPFVAVYVILNQEPRSDVDFFYHKAEAALRGKLVYRDFLSYHAPLFSYFISLPLLLWHNARVIILLMALMEFIIAKATLRYFRTRTAGAVTLFVLYYLLPLPFVAMILSGEEDIWMWGFGLLTLALPAGSRFSLWAGVLWGVGMLVIKFMLIVFLIPLFFIVPNRLQYVAGLLLVGLPSLAILYAVVGMDFLMPIQHSSLPMTPNVVSVLRPVFGTYIQQIPLTYLNWTGLLLTIGASSWLGYRYRALGYRRLLPLLYVLTFGLFMLLLPSSPGYYLFTYALPLVFTFLPLNRPRLWMVFTVLNAMLVIQPILWILYAKQVLYNSWSVLTRPAEWVDYGMQVVEVALLIYVLRACLTQLRDGYEANPATESYPSAVRPASI